MGGRGAPKLKAKPVEVGKYDLVLHPSHLWLTIHESIGHPTELDRALGYEANYAGTSFIAPPEKMLGKLKYGPEFMNVQGDRSQPGACATIGYDDEGVKPEDFLIIKNGVFNDYQTTREQANWLKWWYDQRNVTPRSHGCSNGDSWASIQFQRMPNVSLLPGNGTSDGMSSSLEMTAGSPSSAMDLLDRSAALQCAFGDRSSTRFVVADRRMLKDVATICATGLRNRWT